MIMSASFSVHVHQHRIEILVHLLHQIYNVYMNLQQNPKLFAHVFLIIK